MNVENQIKPNQLLTMMKELIIKEGKEAYKNKLKLEDNPYYYDINLEGVKEKFGWWKDGWTLANIDDRLEKEINNKDYSGFELELTRLINSYSKENLSDTPDFILAKYIMNCLESFNDAVNAREKWYGRKQNKENKNLTMKEKIELDNIYDKFNKQEDIPKHDIQLPASIANKFKFIK